MITKEKFKTYKKLMEKQINPLNFYEIARESHGKLSRQDAIEIYKKFELLNKQYGEK